jgi:hypothetical protein
MPKCERTVIQQTQTVKIWIGRHYSDLSGDPDFEETVELPDVVYEDGCECPKGTFLKETGKTVKKQYPEKSTPQTRQGKIYVFDHTKVRWKIEVTLKTRMTIYEITFECIKKEQKKQEMKKKFGAMFDRFDEVDEQEIAILSDVLDSILEDLPELSAKSVTKERE